MAARPSRTATRWAGAAVAAALVVAVAPGTASARPEGSSDPAAPLPVSPGGAVTAPTAKLTGGLARAKGRQAVFVQLRGAGAADAATSAARGRSAAAAQARRASVGRQADGVVAAARADDSGSHRLFVVSNAVPGVGLLADRAALTALAARSDVVKVSPLVRKHVTNASAAQLTRVLNTWKYAGDTGRGVRIGVIDTGLDYTHADFGGPGTVAAYRAAVAADASGGWRGRLPKAARTKVAGGRDFVGDAYNADPAAADYQPVPNPDPNPLDCESHGTHVSGTAAGYGVTARGRTFSGSYRHLTGRALDRMRVGPGMAPRAALYALKVFGCTGSTNEVIPALDWALDPNGDGSFADHLDIVNMSLGSDYGTVDDPENAVVDELATHGVLSVVAMGNNGDLTDTGGAPGNAVRSLAVASTVDALQLRDGLKVDAPADMAGIVAGQVSAAYDWAGSPPVSGQVVAIPGADADGCAALSGAEADMVAGKVAWLEWDDDDTTRRCGSAGRSANVRAAGAIGAIFTSQHDVFGAGITGDAVIPVFQLSRAGTAKLRPALQADRLRVTFDGKYVATIKDVDPSITDTASGFTSRGTHGSIGVVKPDVAAPGDTISSAFMGTGNDVLSISGTSMATPHTAGISALVTSAHPRWSPEQVKAAVMNTAGHDVWTGKNRTGRRYGPARVGSGRVDAAHAVRTKVLAYSTSTPGAVSASFGVVPVPAVRGAVTRTRRIAVENTGRRSSLVRLRYQSLVSQPGVRYTVSPSRVRVPAHGTRRVKVVMTVHPRALRHTIDPTMAVQQIGVARQFVSDASGRLLVRPAGHAALRVPVFGAAKPVSSTTASAHDGRISLTGTGVHQGTGRTAYRSLASVLELGASSGTLPVCTGGQVGGCTYNRSSRSGDLRYVGAGSSDEWLYFGIATRADWATIGSSITPYVDFDTTGDGEPDYEVFVANYPSTDVLLAELVDLSTNEVIDLEPVNFNTGEVDTNVFDSNVLLLPVRRSAIDAPADGAFPVDYLVGTFDGFTGSDIDHSIPVDFDANQPKVTTAGPLFLDRAGVDIGYRLGDGAATTGAEALLLHLHGAPGKRAEVLDLPGTAPTP